MTIPISTDDGYTYNLKEFDFKLGEDYKTNIVCWWCCHSFSTCSIPIPFNYDEKERTFKSFGNFCSFSCAKAFINNNKQPYKKCSENGLLEFMMKIMTGSSRQIRPAPYRLLLNIFGGPLDIEKFRKYNDENYTFLHYPCIPYESKIQEKIIEKENKVTENKKFSVNKKRVTEVKVKKRGLSCIGIKTIKK